VPPPPRIDGFYWDEHNTEKIWAHGFRPTDVESILLARHAIRRNRKGRRGMYLVVGFDRAGRYITVVVEPFPGRSHIWRPITAWPSKRSEIPFLR